MSEVLTAGREIVAKATQKILFASKKSVRNKGKDIVTIADLLSQETIRKILRRRFPGDLVLSEEDMDKQLDNTHDLPNGRVWVIDPLDGTVNYSRGLPMWSVSLALFEDGEAAAGLVYAPVLGEMFECEGKPTLNGETIAPSKATSLEESLIDVTLLPNFGNELVESTLSVIRKLIQKTKGIRITISGALSLCYVACGRFDALLCPVGGFFSYAAASLVAKRAGCVLTDYEGREYRPGRSNSLVAAATPQLHGEIVSLIR